MNEKREKPSPYRKLFNGTDPRELFWIHTLNRARCACGAPASMRITSSILVSDLEPVLAEAVKIEIAMKRLKPFPTKLGFAVVTGRIVACSMHRKDAELAAAKGPSYAMLEFDYGPGEALKPQVGGPIITSV